MQQTEISKKILRVSNRFVRDLDRSLKEKKLEHAGRCIDSSLALAHHINSKTDALACVCHFWDRHAAVLVDGHVIDPTAKQYDTRIKDLFYMDKSEYIYWLSGIFYMRGVFAMCGPWEDLEQQGKIKKLI